MIPTHKTESTVRPFIRVLAVAAVCLPFLLFIYGYPRLFPAIEASHPDHFEAIVAEALAGGDVDKALLVGRRASEERPNDPAAHTAYGRALLAAGRTDEGAALLQKAVHVSRDLKNRSSHKAFYFAPARLLLGRYWLGAGRPDEAVTHFELARVYARLTDDAYGDFREDLFQAYSGQRLWARALEFRNPTDQELDALDGGALVVLSRVCEGKEDWALAARVAERLVRQNAAEGHYVRGRVELARGQYQRAAEHLKPASDAARPLAAFFLGTAFEQLGQAEQAVRAYAAAQPGDPYRPFALAKARALAEGRPEAQAYEEELEAEVDALQSAAPPAVYYEYPRFVPEGFSVLRAYAKAGGRFPVLILWKDKKAPLAQKVDWGVSASGDSLVMQVGAEEILQLQWVTNRIDWAAVELAGPDAVEAPGWIDTARDWFRLRPDYAARINHGSDPCLTIEKMTWFYSVPVPARHGVAYLITGGVRGPKGTTGLGWQGVDDEENVLSEGSVSNPGSTSSWTAVSAYVRSQAAWDYVRLQLATSPGAGEVSFDDAALLEIVEPEIKPKG